MQVGLLNTLSFQVYSWFDLKKKSPYFKTVIFSPPYNPSLVLTSMMDTTYKNTLTFEQGNINSWKNTGKILHFNISCIDMSNCRRHLRRVAAVGPSALWCREWGCLDTHKTSSTWAACVPGKVLQFQQNPVIAGKVMSTDDSRWCWMILIVTALGLSVSRDKVLEFIWLRPLFNKL